MASSISSARFPDLYSYANRAEQVNHAIVAQADQLISRLSHFNATCEEPAFRVSSDNLGSALRSYGIRAMPVDANVRAIGKAFQRADGQSRFFLGRLAAGPIGRWLPSTFQPKGISVSNSVLSLGNISYEVKHGDSLSEIARRYGLTVEALAVANGIANPDLIHPGLSMTIPGVPPTLTSTPASAPSPMPRPGPLPPPSFFDGINDKPGWWQDRMDQIRKWAPWPLFGSTPHTSTGSEQTPPPPTSTSTPVSAPQIPPGSGETPSIAPPTSVPAGSTSEPNEEIIPARGELNAVILAPVLGNCVEYAKARADWLGQAGGGAYNYIYAERFKDVKFTIADQNTDLSQHIKEGYAVVWDKNVDKAYGDGHVAIVEEVEGDRVRISHTNLPENTYTDEWLTLEQLKLLVIIPKPV